VTRLGVAPRGTASRRETTQRKDLSRLTKQERAETHEDLEATLAEMDEWDEACKARREARRLRKQAAAKKIDEKAQRH